MIYELENIFENKSKLFKMYYYWRPNMFKLVSEYKPTGDQPKAIEYLSKGIEDGKKFQTLLGVTGSRKNLHNGKCNSKSAKTNTRFST